MGRKKLQIKRIEEKSNRQVTFCKRKAGLMKKAKELSVLCDAQLAGVIYSELGKLSDFSYGNSSLDEILQQYHDISGSDGRESTGVYERKNSKCATDQTSSDLLQRTQRYLSELNLDQHNVADLLQLQKDLEVALIQIRIAKITVNEKLLREDNEFLKQQIAEMEVDHNANIAATENGNTNTAATEKGKGLCDFAIYETDHVSRCRETLMLLS